MPGHFGFCCSSFRISLYGFLASEVSNLSEIFVLSHCIFYCIIKQTELLIKQALTHFYPALFMLNYKTSRDFTELPFSLKIWRIISEPSKAIKAVLHFVLSLFGHHNYVPFVILTRSRTGSNMLVQYLNSHPSVFCSYELFAKLQGAPELGAVDFTIV